MNCRHLSEQLDSTNERFESLQQEKADLESENERLKQVLRIYDVHCNACAPSFDSVPFMPQTTPEAAADLRLCSAA